MSFQDFTSKAQKINELVDSIAEKISSETEFVQRKSKMTGSVFAKTLLTGWLKNPQAGLELLCKRAADFGVEITSQGVGKRFNPQAVAYFKQLFEYSLQAFQSKHPLDIARLKQFNGIFLTDSTPVELPQVLADKWKGSGGCASPAALKMQLTFNFLTGNVSAVHLTHGGRADHAYAMDLEAGSLALFDLGYFAIKSFKHIDEHNAFFVSRLRPNTRLFENEQQPLPLDLATFCKALQAAPYETDLFLGADARVPVRVLFSRCPQGGVEQRRRKAKANARRKKRACTAQHLALLPWSIFITNVPKTVIPYSSGAYLRAALAN